jgi:hypothetical protein
MKSGIYSALLSKEKNYIVLNGKPFCNVVSGPSYYRNVWLEICKSIFIQTNKSIVLFGSLLGNPINNAPDAEHQGLFAIRFSASPHRGLYPIQ